MEVVHTCGTYVLVNDCDECKIYLCTYLFATKLFEKNLPILCLCSKSIMFPDILSDIYIRTLYVVTRDY